MRAKKSTKKTYKDYRSSDYGNEDEEEDYGQDFREEEDDYGEEDQNADDGKRADSSEYESGEDKGKRGHGRPRRRDTDGNDDRNYEDTLEDEDPFSPDIDMILADKQMIDSQTSSTGNAKIHS